jgi:hypothetical protein
MAKKRAPGGGRKPRGQGPAQHFNTRIAPEVRHRLVQAAKRNDQTLSSEIERRLRESLEVEERWGGDHHYALARLVTNAAQRIERSAGKRWLDDAFVAQALRAVVLIILNRLMPDAPLQTPESVKKSTANFAAHLPPEQAAFHNTPEGFGSAIAGSILYELETYEAPATDRPSHIHYAENFFLMPRIRKGWASPRRGQARAGQAERRCDAQRRAVTRSRAIRIISRLSLARARINSRLNSAKSAFSSCGHAIAMAYVRVVP